MTLKSNVELMAAYNKDMNSNFYRAASTLSTLNLSKNQGAFFGSIINTLNHILVGDIIWLQRFAYHSHHFSTLDYVRTLPAPTALNTILYSDFNLLKENRDKIDNVIELFVSELTVSVLSQPFSYKNTKGKEFTKNLGHVLQHFFNHQTHHRGQVSTLLYQQGVNIGVTDLLVTIPNVE